MDLDIPSPPERAGHMSSPQSAALDRCVGSIHAFNDADWERFFELVGDMVYVEPPTGRVLQGDAYREALLAWRRAFSDLTGEITNQAVTAETAVLEIVWRGTHDGPLAIPGGELPPTGNTAEVHGAIVYRIEGDRPVQGTHYLDLMAVLRAAGAA